MRGRWDFLSIGLEDSAFRERGWGGVFGVGKGGFRWLSFSLSDRRELAVGLWVNGVGVFSGPAWSKPTSSESGTKLVLIMPLLFRAALLTSDREVCFRVNIACSSLILWVFVSPLMCVHL